MPTIIQARVTGPAARRARRRQRRRSRRCAMQTLVEGCFDLDNVIAEEATLKIGSSFGQQGNRFAVLAEPETASSPAKSDFTFTFPNKCTREWFPAGTPWNTSTSFEPSKHWNSSSTSTCRPRSPVLWKSTREPIHPVVPQFLRSRACSPSPIAAEIQSSPCIPKPFGPEPHKDPDPDPLTSIGLPQLPKSIHPGGWKALEESLRSVNYNRTTSRYFPSPLAPEEGTSREESFPFPTGRIEGLVHDRLTQILAVRLHARNLSSTTDNHDGESFDSARMVPSEGEICEPPMFSLRVPTDLESEDDGLEHLRQDLFDLSSSENLQNKGIEEEIDNGGVLAGPQLAGFGVGDEGYATETVGGSTTTEFEDENEKWEGSEDDFWAQDSGVQPEV
ncbi:MAG: hypothetical protein M1827_007526 [Pycnora praestabilis]|nr:MAG: hypothetical protein M1827_007526 [Pycnora praestabilis]